MRRARGCGRGDDPSDRRSERREGGWTPPGAFASRPRPARRARPRSPPRSPVCRRSGALRFRLRTCTTTTYTWWAPAFALSGPVARDRAWRADDDGASQLTFARREWTPMRHRRSWPRRARSRRSFRPRLNDTCCLRIDTEDLRRRRSAVGRSPMNWAAELAEEAAVGEVPAGRKPGAAGRVGMGQGLFHVSKHETEAGTVPRRGRRRRRATIADPGITNPVKVVFSLLGLIEDVDIVVEVASRLAWHRFEERLRAHGLRNYMPQPPRSADGEPGTPATSWWSTRCRATRRFSASRTDGNGRRWSVPISWPLPVPAQLVRADPRRLIKLRRSWRPGLDAERGAI